MMNKLKVILVVVVTLVGVGLLLYNTLYPKAKAKVIRPEAEYLVYISHEKCEACQSIKEQVLKYESKSTNYPLKFYKIDLNYVKYSDTEKEFGITSTPTLLYIKNGRVYKKAENTENVLKLLEEKYGKI